MSHCEDIYQQPMITVAIFSHDDLPWA